MSCKCNLRTKLVGDGCETCNPELAVEITAENKMSLQDEIAKLKSAIIWTLDDNAHLADGDVCTLFSLKAVLRELGCPWDGDEKTS